jgi:probable phosphoglycerate mutase
MSKQHFYIIRHGETEFNKQNIVQGSGVDTDLNERGQHQAGLFFDAYQNHPFGIVYTSALKRTHQSVNGFLNAGLKHVVLPELNEISWGIFEGQQQTEAQRLVYWETINKWNNGLLDEKIPEGESPIELRHRQKRALEQILSGENHEHVLICMHGRAMKSFLCLLLDLPLTEMEKFQHSNLCLYHVTRTSEGFELVSANNTDHLTSG